jgi:hypothetical protein
MKPEKHLSFGSLRHCLSTRLNQYPEWRQKNKIEYSVHDATMSAFACMYFQSPSLLSFQAEIADEAKGENMRLLFGVAKVPENTQLRNIVDKVASEYFREVFKELLTRLQRGRQLERYKFMDVGYLCDLDGTQFFSSKNLNCNDCLTANHSNGDITCSHKALQAAIVHPDIKQALVMAPEQIANADGGSKQDCELNASRRWLSMIKKDHPRLPLIINADGLYSKQPFIETINSFSYHYILVAKPADHKYMMEWVDAFDEIPSKRITDNKGRTHVWEWVTGVPLNGKKDSILVNFFRYRITSIDKNGKEKTNYKGSWVTDLRVNEDTIEELVRGARSRWKIENECFNTLKNQGYHLEHNYGHGSENLCFNMYILILLAFYFHQIFELTDHLYQACREKLGTKIRMWERIRSAMEWFFFSNWESLLNFVLDPKIRQMGLKTPG